MPTDTKIIHLGLSPRAADLVMQAIDNEIDAEGLFPDEHVILDKISDEIKSQLPSDYRRPEGSDDDGFETVYDSAARVDPAAAVADKMAKAAAKAVS
jgi:hypothetical protein